MRTLWDPQSVLVVVVARYALDSCSPDTAREKPQEGTVAAIGTGKLDDNGKKIEFTVKVGDKVLIYGGTEIKIDGDNYLIMREDDILGIIG